MKDIRKEQREEQHIISLVKNPLTENRNKQNIATPKTILVPIAYNG